MGGATIVGSGVDWIERRLRFGGVPVLRHAERLSRLFVGRSFLSLLMSDRNRELAVAVAETVTRSQVDLVVCSDLGVSARLADVDVPVIALDVLDDEYAAPPVLGLRARLGDAERKVSERRDRRALRRLAVTRQRKGYGLLVLETAPDDTSAFVTHLARWTREREADSTTPEHAKPAQPKPRAHRSVAASVVVATAGRSHLLRQMAPSLLTALRHAPETDLVVVEQGEGAAASIFGECYERVQVISDPGVGASRARNIGATHARGEILLFTDDDCLVPESWISEHVRVLDDAAVGASFGAVIGLSRHGEGDDPARRQRRLSRRAYPWHVGHGSNMAIRRGVLLDIGGWDERLGPGTAIPAGEDADLIARILEGHAVQTGTGVPVVHLDWRSAPDNERNVRAYEIGAGAWIGKAVRARDRRARSYLRGRRRLLLARAGAAPTFMQRQLITYHTVVPFARGFVAGWMLAPADARGLVEGGVRASVESDSASAGDDQSTNRVGRLLE